MALEKLGEFFLLRCGHPADAGREGRVIVNMWL